jgi:hypothetical protein
MTAVPLSVVPEELSITTAAGVEPIENVKTTLQLSNVSFKAVMYRLKTTAPKRYVVKPSKGVIRSNGTETIQIQVCAALDASVKDEFRLEYAAVEDADNVGSKYENVADVLAAKGKAAKFKKDISCVVHVQAAKESPQAKKAQPRAPLSPHTPPVASVAAAAASDDAAPLKAAPFGAQPVAAVPQFGTEKTEAPIGRPVAKPEEPLQRSPVPAAGQKSAATQEAAKFDAVKKSANPISLEKQSSGATLYLFIAALALVVAVLWSLR